MKQADFEDSHRADWEQFEQWLERRGKRRRKQTDAGEPALKAVDVPRAYRRICQLLALARERQYSPELVDRLNRLALGGHHVLYGARGGQSAQLLVFLAAGFPRLVREEWKLVIAAALLFMGPLLLLVAVLQFQPDFVHYLVDSDQLADYHEMYDPANTRPGLRASDDNVLMFAFYIWNNVRIGFQTFATGLMFGLGTIFFLIFNGVAIGAVAGHVTAIGYGETFWAFVSGHSAMELTAIVISGAAGMKLGGALIAPGGRTRKSALVEASRPAVRLMYGAALMFTIAALIEGFWSPQSAIPANAKYVVGIAMWILVIGYLGLSGRSRAA